LAEPSLSKAIEIYNQLEAESPHRYELDLVRCYYYLGKSLEHTKRPEEALRKYRRGLEVAKKAGVLEILKQERNPWLGSDGIPLDPKDVEVCYGQVLAHIKQRELDQAVKESKDVIRIDPQQAGHFKELGDAYQQKGESERALRSYSQAIHLSPTWTEPYRNRQEIYLTQGKHDKAVANWDEALRLGARRSECYAWRGGVHMETGDFQSAIDDFTRAIQHNSRQHGAYGCRGWVYLEMGELDKAIDDFTEAIRCYPEYAAPRHLYRGYAFWQQNRIENALADYNETLRLCPEYPLAYCYRALVLASLGQIEEGLRDVAQMEEMHPAVWMDPYLYHFQLDHVAWFLANCPDSRLRRPKVAIEIARQGCTLRPKAGQLWVALGAAEYRDGNWAAALLALEEAIELPSYRDASGRYFRAMTYWQLGQEEVARRWYDRAVEWTHANRPESKELARFRAEAAELLGVVEDAEKQPGLEAATTNTSGSETLGVRGQRGAKVEPSTDKRGFPDP
jgi:tetratricopeptide (TPR) repeat protein